MNLHPSTKSTRTVTSISKVSVPTLATQEAETFTPNEKADVEREVTVFKVTELAAGLMTDSSTLPHFPASPKGRKKDHGHLDLFPFL